MSDNEYITWITELKKHTLELLIKPKGAFLSTTHSLLVVSITKFDFLGVPLNHLFLFEDPLGRPLFLLGVSSTLSSIFVAIVLVIKDTDLDECTVLIFN